jgi:hypothetical protein
MAFAGDGELDTGRRFEETHCRYARLVMLFAGSGDGCFLLPSVYFMVCR